MSGTSMLKIRQVRSQIGGTATQRDTLRSLGLGRIGREVVKDDRPEIRGMVQTVAHLVTAEAISAGEAGSGAAETVPSVTAGDVTAEEVS